MSINDIREPENTSDTLYIRSDLIASTTLGEIVAKAKKHFETEDIDDLIVSSENIQIRCFGHDQYDGADWRQYLVITK